MGADNLSILRAKASHNLMAPEFWGHCITMQDIHGCFESIGDRWATPFWKILLCYETSSINHMPDQEHPPERD